MADIIDTIDALIAEQPDEERRYSQPHTLTVYALHIDQGEQ